MAHSLASISEAYTAQVSVCTYILTALPPTWHWSSWWLPQHSHQHPRRVNTFTALPPTWHWSCWWLPQHPQQVSIFTALPPTWHWSCWWLPQHSHQHPQHRWIYSPLYHLSLIVLVTATASTTDRRMYSPLYHPPAIDRAGDCHSIPISIHNTGEYIHRSTTCHWSCWWLPQHPQQTRMYSPLYHPPAIDRAGDCHSIALSVHNRQVSCAGGSAVVKRWPVVWSVVGRVVCDPWPDVVSIGMWRQVGNQL